MQWKWNSGTFLHQTVCVMCSERERETTDRRESAEISTRVYERWGGVQSERERERLTYTVLLFMLECETVAVEVDLRYIPPPLCVCHGLRERERDHR